MARTLNPMISEDTRDAMIEFFTKQCEYYEKIAMSSLDTDTLTGAELKECVRDADADTQAQYGYAIGDLFV